VPHRVLLLELGACTDHPKSAIFSSPCKVDKQIRGQHGDDAGPTAVPLYQLIHLVANQEVLRFDITVNHMFCVAVDECL